MKTVFNRATPGRGFVRFAALCLLALGASLLQSREARAQFTTTGTNTTTTNNVGIGTTAPSQQLQIHSTGTWTGTRVTTAAAGDTFNDGVNFGYDDAYGAIIWNREASGIIFATGNAERFRIAAAGNIGIGTATPGMLNGVNFTPYVPLHIQAAGLSNIVIDTASPSSGLVINDSSQPVDGRIWSMTQAAGAGKLTFSTYNDAGTISNKVVIDRAGNVGVGTMAPTAMLHVAGNIVVDGNINAKYQDVAEWVPSTQKLAAGTVVVLDASRGNHVLASLGAYDTRVAGVISAQPGLSLGEKGEGKVLVATTGRVKVKVDATKSPIKIGDLIVTSEVEGVAMKSEPVSLGGVALHRPGTLIGKALESLEKGTGEILVLLSLQ